MAKNERILFGCLAATYRQKPHGIRGAGTFNGNISPRPRALKKGIIYIDVHFLDLQLSRGVIIII